MKVFLWRLRRNFHRIIAFMIGRISHAILSALMFTCRVEVRGLEGFLKTANNGPCLLSVWHNRIPPLVYLLNRFAPQFHYAAAISNSRDGDFLASVIASYPQGRVIRVVHRGRFLALRDCISSLKKGEIIVITPDGPKGPRYQVKSGIVFAAHAACAKTIGLTWAADRYWQFHTWDRMLLPKPFSRLVLSFSAPFTCTEPDRKKGAEALRAFLSRHDREILEAAIAKKGRWPR